MNAQQTAKDLHGYLHRCPKRSEKAPDMTGQAWVAGVCYELVGWVSVSRKNKKYLYIKFTPVET